MSLGRKIFIAYLIIFAAASAIFFSYYLPSSTIGKVNGSEVKRVDAQGPISKTNPANGNLHDVHYLYIQDSKGASISYRNEDTRWGFPWYFKFNSNDLQARAQSTNKDDQLAIIIYYGWHSNMLNQFRNIITLKPTASFTDSTFSFYSVIKIVGWLIWFMLIVVQAATPLLFKNWREERELKKLSR